MSRAVPIDVSTELRAPAAAAAPAADDHARWWMLPLVLLLTTLVFARGLGGEFVYDDLLLVEQNPNVQDWSGLERAFGSSYWDFLGERDEKRIGYWRPLTAITLIVGHELGGGSPSFFHGLSLALHLAATAVAFLLARRLMRSAWVAFWAAALFGVHPLHVESVSWISAINDPLSGVFTLLAVWLFLRWREHGSRGVALGAALAMIPGLLAKEQAIVGFLAIAAVDFGRARGPSRAPVRPEDRALDLARAYAPLVAVAVAYYLVRVAVFGNGLAGFDRATTQWNFDFGRMLLLRLELVGGAIALLFAPLDLNVFRQVHPELAARDLALPLFATAAYAGALAIAIAKALRPALAALLFVPATILPLFVAVGSIGQHPLSDRYLYAAVLGVAMLVPGALLTVLPRVVAGAALAVLCACCAVLSYGRVGDWRDNETLHGSTAEQDPDSIYAAWTHGQVLLRRYQEEQAPALLERATARFEGALAIADRFRQGDERLHVTYDDLVQSHVGAGWCYLLGARVDGFEDYESPVLFLEKVAETYPRSEEVFTTLGAARFQWAEQVADPARSQELFDAAEQAFKRALLLNKDYAPAHHNYGQLLFSLGRKRSDEGLVSLARKQFEQALEQRPNHLEDMVWLARALYTAGWTQRAGEVAEAAHEKHPESAEPPLMLGTVAAQAGDMSGALHWLDMALELDPENGFAHYQKGQVMLNLGEQEEAVLSLRRAADRMPQDFDTHYLLSLVLWSSGAREVALPYAQRAYEIGSPNETRVGELRQTLATALDGDADFAARMAALDRGRGRPDAAIWWIARALEHAPEHGPSLYLRATIERAGGATQTAIETLRIVCRVMPEWFDPHYDLAQLLEEEGRYGEALHYLERAKEIGVPTRVLPQIRTQMERGIEEKLERLRGMMGPDPPPGG